MNRLYSRSVQKYRIKCPVLPYHCILNAAAESCRSISCVTDEEKKALLENRRIIIGFNRWVEMLSWEGASNGAGQTVGFCIWNSRKYVWEVKKYVRVWHKCTKLQGINSRKMLLFVFLYKLWNCQKNILKNFYSYDIVSSDLSKRFLTLKIWDKVFTNCVRIWFEFALIIIGRSHHAFD